MRSPRQLVEGLNPWRSQPSDSQPAKLLEEIAWRDAVLDVQQESIADLQLQLEDVGWLRQSFDMKREFTRDGLRKLIEYAQLMYLKNPLVRRAVSVTKFYVWGLGWSVKAADPKVNAVVQAFLDDKLNKAAVTGQQALKQLDETLMTTGNLFFVFFPNISTGKLSARTMPVEEIDDIIYNPEDDTEPWYYKRVWYQRTLNAGSGVVESVQRTAYYPDWKHVPEFQIIGGRPVMSDTTIYHYKTGGLRSMRFGLPEIYAGLDWARAAKDHLEDWAAVWRTLSRFAMALKTRGGPQAVKDAKTRIATTVAGGASATGETNPPPVAGSMFMSTEGVELQALKTQGARPSPDEGRRLWLMVASALGLPETFFGDADVGNHATAETLDRPTELMMRDRQSMWVDIFGEIFDYVINWAANAPSGPLSTEYANDEEGNDQPVDVSADDSADKQTIDRHVDITFPDLLERSVTERISAILSAATLDGKSPVGTLSTRKLVELLYAALGIDDVDEELDMLLDDNGELKNPPPSPEERQAQAQIAVNDAKATQDKAALGKERKN